jgi:Flp pilus assembly protein protease CpaA
MSDLPEHFREGMIVIPLHEAVVWSFAIILAIAAYGDVKARIIPNRLCLALLALWPLNLWLGASASGANGPALFKTMALSGLGGLEIGAVIFIVGAMLFSRGGLGGGDVKLMTVVGM